MFFSNLFCFIFHIFAAFKFTNYYSLLKIIVMKKVFVLQIFNRVTGTLSVSRCVFTNEQAAVLHQADLLETYKDLNVDCSFEPNNYVFNIIECEIFDY